MQLLSARRMKIGRSRMDLMATNITPGKYVIACCLEYGNGVRRNAGAIPGQWGPTQ